jgi:hypothetical protein
MDNDNKSTSSERELVHSHCATQSRERELQRLRRMSVEERVRAALTMGNRFAWIQPAAAGRRP